MMPRYNTQNESYTLYDMAEVDPPRRKLSAAQILKAASEVYDGVWAAGTEDGDYVYIQFLLGSMVSGRLSFVEMHWANPIVTALGSLPITHPVWRYVQFCNLGIDPNLRWSYEETRGYEDP